MTPTEVLAAQKDDRQKMLFLLNDIRQQLAVSLAWDNCQRLRSRINVTIMLLEDDKPLLP